MPPALILHIITSALLFLLNGPEGLFINNSIYAVCHTELLMQGCSCVACSDAIWIVHHDRFEQDYFAGVFLDAQNEINGPH